MKRKLLYLLFILIATGAGLFCYRISMAIQEPVVEWHWSIKCIPNDETFKWIFESDRKGSPVQEDHPVMASQFYSSQIISFPDLEAFPTKLILDSKPNTILVEKAWLVIYTAGVRDTLTYFRGAALSHIFSTWKNIDLVKDNPSYLELHSESGTPQLSFNNELKLLLKKYQQTHPSKYPLCLILGICIAVLIWIALYNCFNASYFLPFFKDLRNGLFLKAGFLGCIFLIFLNNHWKLIPDKKSHENRKLTTCPAFHWNTLFAYPDQYTSFARDQFSFRNDLCFIHALWVSRLFHESPLPDEVIWGKKDWLFDNDANVVNDFRRLQPYDTSFLHTASDILQQRTNWLAKRHIKFYVFIPPNKNRVYPEYMPSAYTMLDGHGHNNLDLLKLHLQQNAHITLIDPTPALLDAKSRNDVYYSTDTHWNLAGGLAAYQVLIDTIRKDFPCIHPVREADFTINTFFNEEGDLARNCELEHIFRRKEYQLTFKNGSRQLHMPESSALEIRYHQNDVTDCSNLKLLMFRDSYANYLIPFLNLHFREATYVWSYDFLDELIENEKPDVVIFESLQRFMTYSLRIQNAERVVHNN